MFDKTQMVTAAKALPGRDTPLRISGLHTVLKTEMLPPFPDSCEHFYLGMGCFWGAERRMWQQPGVFTTAVGYAAGFTPNPTYEEVCTGLTGHNEVVLVVYRPGETTLEKLLGVFWEAHDPSQGMRQGNDIGTQYRSGIYCSTDEQLAVALVSREKYAAALEAAGHPEITTEIIPAPTFYYAEEYHQQYLDKNPGGYCGLKGTGVSCTL